MTFCVNPDCKKPNNPETEEYCLDCRTQLYLALRYRPVKLLGNGNFGRTFLAVDEYMPSRPYCAIKQLNFLGGSGSEVLQKAIELFNREAKGLESLGIHSQIPSLQGFFKQGQRFYQVQQFIEGLTIEQELQQQGVYDETKIRQFLQDLLPVLQFIHQNNVIHRDIKPQNIIRRASDRKPVLIDFGIAKFVTQTYLVQPGTVVFTPGFAPDEQRDGIVYPASDLYSLGVTCIYLLTGVNSIQMRSNRSWQWRQYLPLGTSISKDLCEIIDKLLQFDVSARYQSAAEVLQALDLQLVVPPTQHNFVVSSSQSKVEKSIYWLMGEQGGKVTINVWNWLWGIPPQSK